MDENIGSAAVDSDESVALFGIEPLDGSLRHVLLLAVCDRSVTILRLSLAPQGVTDELRRAGHGTVSASWLDGGMRSHREARAVAVRLARAQHAQPAVSPDPDQQRVLDHRGGPLLVLGASGTGRTTTMVEVIARRIAEGMAAEDVMVLSSSRRAGQDLSDRVARRLPPGTALPRVTTLYALCLDLLARFAEDGPTPRLLTAPEQELRMREVLAGTTMEWPAPVARAVHTRLFARELREVLTRARQLGMEPEDLQEREEPLLRAAGVFFEEYLQVLDHQQLIDYPELVYRARLLLADDDRRRAAGERIGLLLVDDFEELERSQVALLHRLTAPSHEVMAFADPDQLAFEFRGAATRSSIEFADRWAVGRTPARVEVLGHQWRLPSAVAAANRSVVQRIPALVPSSLTRDCREPESATDKEGSVRAVICDSPGAEVEFIADVLRTAHARENIEWQDMAVVVRDGRRSLTPLVRALSAAEIPVEVAGDEIALSRQLAVRPLLTALAASVERPGLAEIRYLLCSPLGELDISGLRRFERALPGTRQERLVDWFADPQQPVPDGEWGGPVRLRDLLTTAGRLAEEQEGVDVILWHLWSGTTWPQQLRAAALRGGDPMRRADRDLDAVIALFEVAGRFRERSPRGSVGLFLEEVDAQQIPADELRTQGLRGGAVRLLTAHRTKGQQWRLVVVAGVQEGSWPDLRRRGLLLDPDRLDAAPVVDTVSERAALLASERRLFHLACSRASDHLIVTAVQGAEGEGDQASRFLAELGVGTERAHGRPVAPLTMNALVAELRRYAADPELSPALRGRAASELGRLVGAGVDVADPRRWWGMSDITTAPHPLVDSDEPVTLSPSAVELLLTCPRRWFLARRAGADVRRSPAAEFGQLIHRVIEEATVRGATPASLRDTLTAVWERTGYAARWQADVMLARAGEALDRYQHWHTSHRDREAVAAEVGFTSDVTLPDGHRLRLRGTIDRIERHSDGALQVVDFKTGTSVVSRADAERHLQLAIYQLAVAGGDLADVVGAHPTLAGAELVYLQVSAGKNRPGPAVRNQPPLADPPDWLVEQLTEAARLVRTEEFPAVLNPGCRTCPVRASCPAQQSGGDR